MIAGMPCIFCQRPFTPENPDSNEHLFRTTWLKALGHMSTPMPTNVVRNGVVVQSREPAAKSVVAGRICKECNQDWMEKLDESVSDNLLALARGKITMDALDADAFSKLARWVFKTTCVLRSCTPEGFRQLDTALLKAAMLNEFLPRGFIAFAHCLPAGTKALGASSIGEALRFDPFDAFSQFPQSQWARGVFQYDSLMIGCCWFTTTGIPIFHVIPGVHDVFRAHDAQISHMSESQAREIRDFASSRGQSPPTFFQMTITCSVGPQTVFGA